MDTLTGHVVWWSDVEKRTPFSFLEGQDYGLLCYWVFPNLRSWGGGFGYGAELEITGWSRYFSAEIWCGDAVLESCDGRARCWSRR